MITRLIAGIGVTVALSASAAFLPSIAAAQSNFENVLPERLAEIKAGERSSQASRCASAYAIMARMAERRGENENMLRHRNLTEYWIAVSNAFFTEKWAERRIQVDANYWIAQVERDHDHAESLLLAQQLICEQLQKRLEGTD